MGETVGERGREKGDKSRQESHQPEVAEAEYARGRVKAMNHMAAHRLIEID